MKKKTVSLTVSPWRESEVYQRHFGRNFRSIVRIRKFRGDVKSIR